MSARGRCQDDDWMVKALKRYESLHMFEMPQATCCIEWSQRDTAIFVAGDSPDVSSEISQLALPDRLLPTNTEAHWAGGKRDFRLISGAFVSYPVKAMKYLASHDMLASAGSKPFVTLWATDQHNSDCLVESAQLNLQQHASLLTNDRDTQIFLDAGVDRGSRLLAGSSACLATVELLDIPTGKPCFTLGEALKDTHLHGLSYVTMATDLIVTLSGQYGDVDIWDTRVGGVKPAGGAVRHRETRTPSQSFGFAVSRDPYPATKLARLNGTSGAVQLFDCRQPKVTCASCDTSEGGGAVASRFRRGRPAPCVKFGPTSSKLLSVSGCTPGVKVHDTTLWNCADGMATPLFTHTGHEEESPSAHVSVHTWQPSVQATILSADTEGSLHAWQWKS